MFSDDIVMYFSRMRGEWRSVEEGSDSVKTRCVHPILENSIVHMVNNLYVIVKKELWYNG